jgi:hypothetical protein
VIQSSCWRWLHHPQAESFSALADDTAESTIQWQFGGLVEDIADRLAVDLVSDSETKIILSKAKVLSGFDDKR